MRLVSLVGSRHDDHHCDPNGGSGGATTTTAMGQLRLQLGPQRAVGWFAMRTSPCRPTTSAGWMRTHDEALAIACGQFCVHCRYAAGTVGGRVGGGAPRREMKIVLFGRGEMGLPAAKTQGHRGRRRTGETGRIQTPERKGSREEDGDESGRGEGGKDVCEKKGGWGKRAKSADDVLPSESAKFTALGSDAQRRSWGVREQRMAPRFAGSGRHKLWRSIQGWRALVAQHGCNALYQGADWLQRHCTPRQGRN
ncbi:hypothetical protein COCVIDRAFT_18460 [Bipolaris victoriae FI3]|uniref:Uncharacterized protein n=1 Tax=Bipolaris victoriae (strain FI3) TaxID=930091 RepID=W7EIL9_BIPV3|nr:hypothetical protein COCVIDRAFT_18460 [Bipolaris victoriae FI3]